MKKAYFAGGCFWGVEHLMKKIPGVLDVFSGYMGGHIDNPSYEQVCTKLTGHIETVEVVYDETKVDFTTLAKAFFEIHDPSQEGGQGPDMGPQYISAIFYNNESEKECAEDLIKILESSGLNVVTELIPVKTFWKAEEYHQNYYTKTGKTPYCHTYKKRF
ncbi:peptide-methionine (S)-S-oxide reductase [Paraphotobacterium marinum]|uniref:Peptide methionine sulfoxide reductase MsrA n=1 Tax=Paraphotobacterium marinum TaxID=1755811 RepID=A0A220VGI0_9GAMM|nr:peptide-methionine (S)-S-oxide reductase MsrA [Paraphotobacterium marinum]ASK79411.1 peptide-methionine (S)-S-oxide reductase [Paraphotobacterium marinum]